jgi:hypothetical protein
MALILSESEPPILLYFWAGRHKQGRVALLLQTSNGGTIVFVLPDFDCL